MAILPDGRFWSHALLRKHYYLAQPDPQIVKRNQEIARLVSLCLEYPEVAERLGYNPKKVAWVIRCNYPELRRDPGGDDAIRREHKSGKTQRALAEKYGLSRSQISIICHKILGGCWSATRGRT